MKEYLIDGYNFLFRIPTKKAALEQKRESLIRILNQELHSFKAHINIIFDSSEEIREFAQKKVFNHLEVIYAPKGKTADEYILELVHFSKNPKILTIVTSDNALAKQCHHAGASSCTIEQFIALLMKRNHVSKSTKPNYKETPAEIKRLLKIFEEKLNP